MSRNLPCRNVRSAWSTAFRFLVGGLAISSLLAIRLAAAEPELKDLKAAQAKTRAIAERIRAATVGIINPGLEGAHALGEGSGVVVSEDGLIITAGHLLGKPGGELAIIFPDGRRATAKTLGADFTRDAGMAKIVDGGKFPHVEIGRMSDVKPGAWCVAIGHPGGIHAGRTPPLRLGRVLAIPSGNGPLPFLLSDATVISGDSGGPLFDLEGRVIGIHSNIGMGVTENRHVPIDVYRDKWQDMLAGKQTGKLALHPAGHFGPGGPMPDFQKFSRLLHERVAAGDPEAKALVKGGHVMVTPEQMSALIAKWEKKTDATPAAQDAIDVIKFNRLLQERLVAGDAEVRGLIKDGGLRLTMAEMQNLLKKWDPSAAAPPAQATAPASTPPATQQAAKPETAAKPATPPAALMGDVQRFQKLLQQRLMAGDAEVWGMVQGGQMHLTPDKMRELIQKWEKKDSPSTKSADEKKPEDKKAAEKKEPEKKEPEKKPADAKLPPTAGGMNQEKLAELLKHAKAQGNGHFQLEVTPENAGKIMGLMKQLGMGGLPGMPKGGEGKASAKLLGQLAPLTASPGKSTVTVLCDGKPTVLGTIVRKDGCILTKSSELQGAITCKIGDRVLPAVIVKKRDDFDLALLKVNVGDLAPVAWATDAPALGSWLLAADAGGKPVGLGIVSIAARPIPKNPSIMLRNRAAIGTLMDQHASNARIEAVAPGGPAEKAGLKSGDIVTAIDGQPIATAPELVKLIGKHNPGDKLHVDVKRGDKAMHVTAELVASDKMAASAGHLSEDKLAALSKMGGSLSKRKSEFPTALTHDIVLQAAQCGGPLLDLDGRVVGLNIARADRTATYAIPAATLQPVIGELLKAVK
jgi:S1-C subfamily serine protease